MQAQAVALRADRIPPECWSAPCWWCQAPHHGRDGHHPRCQSPPAWTQEDHAWMQLMRTPPRERDLAWRGIGALHDEATSRERRGRSSASYSERADVDSIDTTARPALYRREKRRRDAGLVDALSPRAREFVNALPSAARRHAILASPPSARPRPFPRRGPLHIREIDRAAFDAWPPRGPRPVSSARVRRRARR